ncbi:MAG: DNA primase [Planctomycetota bacterium]
MSPGRGRVRGRVGGLALNNLELKKRQILDRVDLYEVVAEQVALKRSGRRWLGLCPFHSEKSPSFTVSPELGLFKCFGCGRGGDVFSFVQLRENVPFMEAFRILADRAGISLDEPKATSSGVDEPGRGDIAKVNEWAARFFRAKLRDETIGRSAREYVAGRALSDAVVDGFGLGLAVPGGPSLRTSAAKAGFSDAILLAADLIRRGESGDSYDTFRDRLMFPIRDAGGRVLGFGGRTLIDDRAKYLNTSQNVLFDKGSTLYGIDVARKAMTDRRRAVVVEGYTDCLACHQCDVGEAVATLGTALTESHVNVLRRFCEEVILLFDSDQAGEAAAERAVRVAVPMSLRVRLARIPDGKDPCDYLGHGSGAFSDVLNHAVDALELAWLTTLRRFGGGSSDGKRREAVLDFLRLVADASSTRAVDPIQRGLLINQVAHLLRMDRDEVRRMVTRTGQRPPRPSTATAVSTGAARSSPRDSEQSAWATVLEIGLNEPALLMSSFTELDPSRITDPRDRRIAAALLGASEELGAISLADMLARCGVEGDAARVEELARRGAERGRFAETLAIALERIAQRRTANEAEEDRELMLSPSMNLNTDERLAEQTLRFAASVSQNRHFAPRRAIRQAIAAAEMKTIEKGVEGRTTETP